MLSELTFLYCISFLPEITQGLLTEIYRSICLSGLELFDETITRTGYASRQDGHPFAGLEILLRSTYRSGRRAPELLTLSVNSSGPATVRSSVLESCLLSYVCAGRYEILTLTSKCSVSYPVATYDGGSSECQTPSTIIWAMLRRIADNL